jgi:ribosome biogenesis GTPase / thiamine phosphate phosphatase
MLSNSGGFIEFQPFLGQCQFRNCEHKQEPGCALRQAVQQGHIAAFRLENYHTILEDVSHVR